MDSAAGKPHHRRALSDTLFRFRTDSDDDLFSDFNFDSLDIMALDAPSKSDGPDFSNPNPPGSHLRSASVGADFFDGLDLSAISAGEYSESERSAGKPPPSGSRPRHRHSNSMDGSVTSSLFEGEIESMKKSMGADRLAELALIDPKRAKRILANRQSAARSKERKIRYTGELERKVQTLQSEATNLSAQVTMLQRGTTELTAENKELKYKLQAMEQQAHLREALNEALKDEVQRLKIAAGQIGPANGNPYVRASPQQFSSRPPIFLSFSNNQNQQKINLSQSANTQSSSSQRKPTFMDFNHRVQ